MAQAVGVPCGWSLGGWSLGSRLATTLVAIKNVFLLSALIQLTLVTENFSINYLEEYTLLKNVICEWLLREVFKIQIFGPDIKYLLWEGQNYI